MKDKLLEILKKRESCPFAGHSFLSAIDKRNYPEIVTEIESLIKENYVEKKFIEWVAFEMQRGNLWHEDLDNTYNY